MPNGVKRNLESVRYAVKVIELRDIINADNSTDDALRIGFGGGCHWCTEAVFMSLRGVSNVLQGFVQSTPPNDALSEAVVIEFDDAQITQDVLIDVHLRTHASTAQHSMRGKYRSAIYTFNDNQRRSCEQTLRLLQTQFSKPIVTQVLPFEQFEASDDRYHNYYYQNVEKAFCKTYIDPKITLLRERYKKYSQEP